MPSSSEAASVEAVESLVAACIGEEGGEMELETCEVGVFFFKGLCFWPDKILSEAELGDEGEADDDTEAVSAAENDECIEEEGAIGEDGGTEETAMLVESSSNLEEEAKSLELCGAGTERGGIICLCCSRSC